MKNRIKRIKDWLFIRKLNKAIKGYGAKAYLYPRIDELFISMRGNYCSMDYSTFKLKYISEKDMINQIIKEIKIMNVKEAYK